MSQPARRRATFEDMDAYPEGTTVHLIDGQLQVMPRPAPAHLAVQSRLNRRLGVFDDPDDGDPGGWRILVEPELRINGEACTPDLAGWRVERLPVLPSTAYFETVPDWICEVISPSTEIYDRATKLPALARFGAEWSWVIDPVDRTLEVSRLDREHRIFRPIGQRYQGHVKAEIPPFEAILLDVGRLWG